MILLEAVLLQLPPFTHNILQILSLYYILLHSHKSLEMIVGTLYNKIISKLQTVN